MAVTRPSWLSAARASTPKAAWTSTLAPKIPWTSVLAYRPDGSWLNLGVSSSKEETRSALRSLARSLSADTVVALDAKGQAHPPRRLGDLVREMDQDQGNEFSGM